MKDKALHLEVYAPAAGATVAINPMDLGVDQPGFSDNWRQGRVRVSWPALPNLTSTSDTIKLTLTDSGDSGATYATTVPAIVVTVTGVASTGAAAGYVDCPLPPGLRGPLGLSIVASAGAGDNTAALLTADWLNE